MDKDPAVLFQGENIGRHANIIITVNQVEEQLYIVDSSLRKVSQP